MVVFWGQFVELDSSISFITFFKGGIIMPRTKSRSRAVRCKVIVHLNVFAANPNGNGYIGFEYEREIEWSNFLSPFPGLEICVEIGKGEIGYLIVNGVEFVALPKEKRIVLNCVTGNHVYKSGFPKTYDHMILPSLEEVKKIEDLMKGNLKWVIVD